MPPHKKKKKTGMLCHSQLSSDSRLTISHLSIIQDLLTAIQNAPSDQHPKPDDIVRIIHQVCFQDKCILRHSLISWYIAQGKEGRSAVSQWPSNVGLPGIFHSFCCFPFLSLSCLLCRPFHVSGMVFWLPFGNQRYEPGRHWLVWMDTRCTRGALVNRSLNLMYCPTYNWF
jgi:hypothetical protein